MLFEDLSEQFAFRVVRIEDVLWVQAPSRILGSLDQKAEWSAAKNHRALCTQRVAVLCEVGRKSIQGFEWGWTFGCCELGDPFPSKTRSLKARTCRAGTSFSRR